MQSFDFDPRRWAAQILTMAILEALRPFVQALVESFLEGTPPSFEIPTLKVDFGDGEVPVDIPPEVLERWRAIKERMQRQDKGHEG